MSEIIDSPPGPLQFTGPYRGVLRVGGQPPMARRAARDEDGWEGIEYTSPHPGMMRVGGRPVAARRPDVTTLGDTDDDDDTGDDSTYWRARRRAELADERRRHPDFRVYGCAVPYKIKLDGGRDDVLVFSIDTQWILPKKTMMLRTEHSGLAGNFEIDETPGGLYCHGTILGGLRRLVGDRRDLSPALSVVDSDCRPDGTLDVRTAILREVSLVRRPHWAPHTGAAIWQLAAA